jgi:hypothetical protein
MSPLIATLLLVLFFLGAAYLLAEALAVILVGSSRYRRRDRADGPLASRGRRRN